MHLALRLLPSLLALAAATLSGCTQSVETTSAEAEDEVATRAASIEDAAGTFRLTVADQAKFEVRGGKRVLAVYATASRNLAEVFSWVPDDAFGQARLLSARKYEVVLTDDHEVNSVLSGMPLYVRMTPSVAGSKPVHARLVIAPRLAQFSGDAALRLNDVIRPIYVRTDADNPLRYRGALATTSAASNVTVVSSGASPTVGRVDSKSFTFDWPFVDFAAAAAFPKGKLDVRAKLGSSTKSKSAAFSVNVTDLDLTTGVPEQVWPSPSCAPKVAQCIKGTAASALDFAACGDYRAVSTCIATQPAIGQVSALFPASSQFIRPLEMAWMPADTDRSEIEETAHVVDYRTANRKHTCELWWTGGDGGTPVLSYLVDETGAAYLPTLSQPKSGGNKPFQSVEEAKQTFIQLAEEHYVATDAVRAYFGSIPMADFATTSLPGGARIDARPGQAARAGVPAEVLEAFDFFYRVEQADWGSVSLHRGALGGVGVYALYTSTDGDDSWLEVFSRSGTPLASARFFGGALLGWDEFFGRTRQSTGLESLWGMTTTEGYSEPADKAKAGQIPVDWAPTVTLDRGTLSSASEQLTTVALTPASPLSIGQRELAYAALQILWVRSLRFRLLNAQTLALGPQGQGTLRLGTFTSPITQKFYWVADWKDIDDASFTLYFERKNDLLLPAIQQVNN